MIEKSPLSPPVKTPEFAKVEEEALELAEGCFFKFNKIVFFFSLFKDGLIIPLSNKIQIMMNDLMSANKDIFVKAMSVVVKEAEADIVCVMNECWMTQVPVEKYDPANFVSPSKSPDRKEMVLVTIEDRNMVSMSMAPIIRGGVKPLLGKWDTNVFSKLDPTIGGRMMDFFGTGVDRSL